MISNYQPVCSLHFFLIHFTVLQNKCQPEFQVREHKFPLNSSRLILQNLKSDENSSWSDIEYNKNEYFNISFPISNRFLGNGCQLQFICLLCLLMNMRGENK